MAYSKARRLSDSISATGEISSFVDASIVPADLHSTLDLTGKTITVATASASDNDTTVASTAFVQQELASLVDSAPGTLNTLNELAAALGDDASFSTTVTNSIATKLPLAGGTLTGHLRGTTFATNLTTTVGVGGTPADANTAEIGPGYINLARDDTASAKQITFGKNGAVHSYIETNSDGVNISGADVGIGTSFPGVPLQVNGQTSIFNGASGNVGGISIAPSNTDTQIFNNSPGSYGDYGMRFKTMKATGGSAYVDALYLKYDGSAGIGTTSPDGQLHVKGATNKTLKLDPTFSSGTFTALAFARNGTDKWRVFQDGGDAYLSFFNDTVTKYQFSLASNGKIFANIAPGNFSSYDGLGTVIFQQVADNRGLGVIDVDASNTFKFINNGDEAKIEHNGSVPIKIESANVTRMTIGSDGTIKSGSGGMVLQTKEVYANTATSISTGGSAVICSTTITVKAGSKLCVWGHSGQIQNNGNGQNPNMLIQWDQSGTTTNISDHNGNHYGWDASTHVERMFMTSQGISGTLSAGTYTVRLLGGAYNGPVVMNYQGQGSHMIIQEISAD